MSDSRIVHLIDDDEDVRKAVGFLLGSAGLAVKTYESAAAFLDKHQDTSSGCIVSDVRMPGINGIELLRRLREKGATIPVIVMTGHADIPLAVEAMKSGAADFIEKPFADDVILAAISAALNHGGKSEKSGSATGAVRDRLALLSDRERQVLDGLLVGHPNKTIAYDLGLSPRTVEVHRAHVMTKMAASSLSELVRMVILAQAS